MSRSLSEELQWLKDNPQFRERPATLREFLGPDYLDIEGGVRERIKEVLAEIMGEEVNPQKPTAFELAIFTGAIGIGKTTVASIVLPYLVHWVLCLKDPQGFFNLLPGSRIAFMMMSTKASQAREVLFSDIKARINHSPWFKNYPTDPNFRNQIRFDRDIWILPGDSLETTFEGYNILGGILDEADSHKITQNKDYAEVGFETIYNRMSSRFGDSGFLLIIGQMKEDSGFAGRKYREFLERDDAAAFRLTIWESMGDDYYRDEAGEVQKFWYDTKRKQIVPDLVVTGIADRSHLLHIPKLYEPRFRTNPEKALKDLAGIPPIVQSPFISLVEKIYHPRERWVENHFRQEGPVNSDNRIATWFRAPDTLPRVLHLDIAYSGDNGDSLGMAMGHIPRMVEIDGERKPYIVIDFLYRMKAPPGLEVHLGDARHVIYHLITDLGFKIKAVTMDGFQSVDTRQQLQKRRIMVDNLSVDKELLPYHDLREALYEDRIEFPPYEANRNVGDGQLVDILTTELEQLMDLGRKIDHPKGGSKDVADCVAAVTSHLMGNLRYHRKNIAQDYAEMATPLGSHFAQHPLHRPLEISHPAYIGMNPGVPPPPTLGRRS